jgi:hypothetical protein
VEERKPWEITSIAKRLKPWVLDNYLTDYQCVAWERYYNDTSAMLWWACGSGKTLAACLYLVSLPRATKKLVVTRAPAKRQWHVQFSQYTDIRPVVLSGYNPYPIDDTCECVVISWEMLTYWYEDIKAWADRNGLAIVWDEIHKGKSWRRKEKYVTPDGSVGFRWMTNRAAAAARLAKLATYRMGLTATPIRDRRSDLWAQLDLVQPGVHGTNWQWVHKFCDAKPGVYGGLDVKGTSNCVELKEQLDALVHAVSYQEMALALPPKRRQLVYLPPSELASPRGFVTAYKKAAKQGPSAQFEVSINWAAATKRPWIKETVKDLAEAGQKVTVFTGRRKDAEMLGKVIRSAVGKGIPVWSGHGGNSLDERQTMVQEYADTTGAGVLVGTHDAFGEAIDGLQNTDTAIFALLPWTPGQVTQAEGRFSRHGSDRPVLIMYVIAEGTVDERVADVLLEKLDDVSTTLADEEAGGLADTLSGKHNEDEILAEILDM